VDNKAVAINMPRGESNRRTKTAAICGVLLLLIVGIFVAGSLIDETDVAADFSRKGVPPSLAYPFGTDWLGRNMLLRTIKGLSLSITVGMVASTTSAVLATLIGVAAATGSKWLDSAINWLIDLVMGIPHLVLLILIAFACGRGMKGLLVGVALTHWTSLARLIRAEVLQIRGQRYIMVSRRLGHSAGWILRHHFLPHILPQFVVGLVLLFPHAILHESALSFLGYGLPPEQPAVGIVLSESMRYLTGGMWWLAVFPGVSLVLVVLLFDKLGDNLKMLFDPASAQE
jgi:ABC-type dipeptide/oligopeptide/nickel transport systems, permease components